MAKPGQFIFKGRAQMLKPTITQFLAMHQLLHGKDLGEMYGIPTDIYQDYYSFKPQVKLFFKQDQDAVPAGFSAIRAEITFRLQGETSATINPAKASILATSVKQEMFTGSTPFTWTKGKVHVTYIDPEKAYHLRIYASSRFEGEKVVKKILDIRNDAYESDKLIVHTPERESVNNPTGHKMIYGQMVDNARWRPTANVKFQWASLQIHGKYQDVFLVDATGRYRDALIKVQPN